MTKKLSYDEVLTRVFDWSFEFGLYSTVYPGAIVAGYSSHQPIIGKDIETCSGIDKPLMEEELEAELDAILLELAAQMRESADALLAKAEEIREHLNAKSLAAMNARAKEARKSREATRGA